MNNGSSYSGNNKHTNQNGKSYRGYHSGYKPNDTYKKTSVNKYSQRISHGQPRTTYPNSVNNSSRYQGRSGPSHDGTSHNSTSDIYYKKPHNKTNNYYSDGYQEQGYQGTKKYSPRRYTGAAFLSGHKNTADALLDETKSSMFHDVLARYHQYYKKQLERNVLSEQEFIEKFEEVKKAYMGNTKLDEELKVKLGENQEKLKLDKLQYDISILHYENIENIKGLEAKISDDINLM